MKKFALWMAVGGLFLNLFNAQPSTGSDGEPHALVSQTSNVEKLAGGFKSAEGPVWDPRGFLLFSDISANTIYKWTSGKVSVFRYPSGYANGNTLNGQGRLVTAQHSRRVTRTEKSGTVVTLADRYQGKRLNSPNDVVVKSDGNIYFTDPRYGIKKQQEELGFYGVYRLSPDGSTLTLLAKDFAGPNGLAFSPDEKKLYVNDSDKQHIRVFDVKSNGTLTNGRIFADLKLSSQYGVPDGMKVDVQGNVYCTGSGGVNGLKGVWIFSPTGKLLRKIITPEFAKNLAWGDKDYKTLYITTSNSLYRVHLNVAGVQPGT